ncbi:glycosyltransferase family 9 protein [Chitinilyticum piscinae]|uniref:Glycosyltransferase family 9 protein n=1 Tax=Chitinilyticum piscinae TaxID=2866724 RepID=A0A8J7FHW0_9NEIS|nr:glycosyltransferase family 9 protein [Chitinilyticum piscinae]MBE9608072.1 glycosyltransferase family 9 protein [Chitinilyticum piscinae]
MKILLIRRDNIGDLVCTTPLFDAIRLHFPNAYIAVLANSYNADILAGNPAIDKVFVYTKAKHRNLGQSRLGVYLETAKLILRLRRQKFDYAIPVGGGWFKQAIKFARLSGARHIISFTPENGRLSGVDIPIPYNRKQPRHEVEDIFRLLAPLGIEGTPGSLKAFTDPETLTKMQMHFQPLNGRTVLGVHLSAREANRRWPADRFITAIRKLTASHPNLGVALLWAPGSQSDPKHPGDDELAAEVVAALAGLPVLPVPTSSLHELTAALSCTDLDLLSDGGALHIAAAMQKPIAAMFENRQEKLTRWYPWRCPHQLIIAPELAIRDIPCDAVISAVSSLLDKHFHNTEASA